MKDVHPQNNVATAIRLARRAKGMSQEDFSLVSSRTYLSSLERGLKSPTLNKLDELAAALGIHPLTLLTMAYLKIHDRQSTTSLLSAVMVELAKMQNGEPHQAI